MINRSSNIKRRDEIVSESCPQGILDKFANKFGVTRVLLFILLFVCGTCALGADVSIQPITMAPVSSNPPPAIVPQSVKFENCYKYFKMDSQRLFYLTLAGVNANRFQIDEIQSKSGYVLFSIAKKQFLASVIIIDSKSSMLKIVPCDNIYFFPIGIVQNMFKYIELNINTSIERLKVI